MNKSIFLWPVGVLCLASCIRQPQMEGQWMQPVPGLPHLQQGFILGADGKAESVNMSTLRYETWHRQGEIVVKGENVMAGYWKNPDATASTVRDGWLYTGDLGYMSSEGLLYVMGRFKSLLIGSDGEKYSPEGIEEALVETCDTIDQVMLYNNQSPYTTALIVPNREVLKRRGCQLSTTEGCQKALKEIQSDIQRFHKGGDQQGLFPERWLPATFAVLKEPFTEQNQMINSTMKMVRGKIEKAYAERLKYIYTSQGKTIDNPQNLEALNQG